MCIRDRKTKLVKNSDGSYSLTDLAARSTAKFGTDGKLVSLTDRNKQAITLAYSGGNISQATLPTGLKRPGSDGDSRYLIPISRLLSLGTA